MGALLDWVLEMAELPSEATRPSSSEGRPRPSRRSDLKPRPQTTEEKELALCTFKPRAFKGGGSGRRGQQQAGGGTPPASAVPSFIESSFTTRAEYESWRRTLG